MATDTDSVASDLPNMPLTNPAPFKQSSKSIFNNVPSLPFNILLCSSNNTKFSLQLTELTETPNSKNNIDPHVQQSPTPESNVTFKFNKDDQCRYDHGHEHEHEHKKKEDKNYRLGDLVIISKNKQGLIRYIGELHGDTHIWYGIELIGGHKGFHDGTFQGHTYFVCGIHAGMFVKKHQISRKMSFTDFHSVPHTTKPYKYKSPKTPKKLGPRDIGKIKGWKPSRDIYKTQSELKQQQLRKKYKAQHKTHRKRSSLTDIESELSSTTLSQVEKKAGPRDIGRVHSNNTDWKPIADADKIIQEQQKKVSFLGVFKNKPQRRNRAKSSLLMRKSGHQKSKTALFRKGNYKEKKKLRQNKSEHALLPFDSIGTRQRSKTPTPSTTGLRYTDSNENAVDVAHKKSSKRRKKKRNKAKHQVNYSEDNCNATILPIDCSNAPRKRSKSRNKKQIRNDLKNKTKIRQAKKYKLELGRSRSHTADTKQSRLTLNKANSAGGGKSGKCELEFPDILKFEDEPMLDTHGRHVHGGRLLGGNRKKRKKKRSKDIEKAVIIRVSSEADVEEKRHRKKGLNMSRTGMEDEVLFAEVYAEIEQRKSGVMEIEQQLNALQDTDFDMEFDKALEEAQQTQNQFKRSNSEIIEVMESDLEQLQLSETSRRKINCMKNKDILWVEQDSDGDKNGEVSGYVE